MGQLYDLLTKGINAGVRHHTLLEVAGLISKPADYIHAADVLEFMTRPTDNEPVKPSMLDPEAYYKCLVAGNADIADWYHQVLLHLPSHSGPTLQYLTDYCTTRSHSTTEEKQADLDLILAESRRYYQESSLKEPMQGFTIPLRLSVVGDRGEYLLWRWTTGERDDTVVSMTPLAPHLRKYKYFTHLHALADFDPDLPHGPGSEVASWVNDVHIGTEIYAQLQYHPKTDSHRPRYMWPCHHGRDPDELRAQLRTHNLGTFWRSFDDNAN